MFGQGFMKSLEQDQQLQLRYACGESASQVKKDNHELIYFLWAKRERKNRVIYRLALWYIERLG